VSAPEKARARRGLAIYLVIVAVLSGAIQARLLATGEPITKHPLLVVALMWVPTLAAIVARVALREGVRDVSFRFGGRTGAKMLIVAWLYPAAVGVVAYGAAWSTGLERFAPPESGAFAAHAPLVRLALSVAIMATVGTVMSAITAAGEELGWRGYMLTRLIDAGVPRPILVSGLIWGAWHVPLILSGQYAAGRYPWLSALLFVPGVVSAGYVAARVRLASGSVWPAVVFHSAWNALIQGSFDAFTVGGDAARGTTLWTGEGGILVVLVNAAFALALVARPFEAKRSPREPPFATLDVRRG
jgi:uncharacterized protein